MISTIILLGVWRYVFNLGAERGLNNAEPENSGWWPLSFVIAAGLLSSINSLELVTLNSATAGRLLVYGQTAASTVYLIRELTSEDKKYRLKIDLLDNLETRFNRALAAVSFGIICIFSIAIAAPLSWDSNAYNLARVPIFMFENKIEIILFRMDASLFSQFFIIRMTSLAFIDPNIGV